VRRAGEGQRGLAALVDWVLKCGGLPLLVVSIVRRGKMPGGRTSSAAGPSPPSVPRYYEPLAQEAPDLETLLSGPPVKKLLFMAPPEVVEGAVKPHWGAQLAGSGAEVLQAVPNMLEVVPAGVNKWAGLQVRGGTGVGGRGMCGCGERAASAAGRGKGQVGGGGCR
jgi:hypothetical protein